MAPWIDTLTPKWRLLVLMWLAVAWEVGGAMMAFNPPPHGYRRAASLPVIGLIVMAGGIYFAFKALREPRTAQSDKPPRHASAEEPSVRQAVKILLGAVFLPVGAGFAIWDGIRTGQLSLVGLGVCCASFLPGAIPVAAETATGLLRRKRH